MNESPSASGIASNNAPVDALRTELQSLRTLVVCTLAMLILLSVSLNYFLMKQASAMAIQTAEMQRNVNEFLTVTGPHARDFWIKLNDYGKTHSDILPLIGKYSPYMNFGSAPAEAPKK